MYKRNITGIFLFTYLTNLLTSISYALPADSAPYYIIVTLAAGFAVSKTLYARRR
jgi:hypothetical protein